MDSKAQDVIKQVLKEALSANTDLPKVTCLVGGTGVSSSPIGLLTDNFVAWDAGLRRYNWGLVEPFLAAKGQTPQGRIETVTILDLSNHAPILITLLENGQLASIAYLTMKDLYRVSCARMFDCRAGREEQRTHQRQPLGRFCAGASHASVWQRAQV